MVKMKKKKIDERKLYLLIESDQIYKKRQESITGRVIDVVISNERPGLFMCKNKIFALKGRLYKLNMKDKIEIPNEFERIRKNLDKLRRLR